MTYRLTLICTLGIALTTSSALAVKVNTNLFYDNSAGPNSGGNITTPDFIYVDTLTDATTGVVFDIEVRLAAAGGTGNLRTNGGTTDREFGVEGNNAAIDTVGESITASLQSLTVTDFGGNSASDVSVTFDGFTDMILFFVDNDGDSGEVTDGSNTLFEWNGSLVAGSPDTTLASGVGFTPGISGQSASNTNNARVEFSGVLPQTLVAASTAFSGSGTPVDPNRWRVDDFGVQFDVTVTERDLLTLRVTPNEMSILGGGVANGVDLDIDFVEIASDAGSLTTGTYTGLGGNPSYPAGSGTGDGWEFGSNNDSQKIIESYLLGSSTVAIDQEVMLGDGFDASGARDLSFTYHRVGDSQGTVGNVVYVLTGDFNGDLVVDGADYAYWRNNLGANESVLNGTGDQSGTVDSGDLNLWLQNFGISWAAPASASASTVPEPGAMGLAMLSTIVAGVWRRRSSVGCSCE